MSFKIGNCSIDLDSDYKTIWSIIKKAYQLKKPYINKIYALDIQYRWGGSHTKYNKIEVKGFDNIESIGLTFYDDTDDGKLYSITANLKSGHLFTLYNVQDKDKLKNLADYPNAQKSIMGACSY